MKDSSTAGLPDDFVSQDDEELFAFVNTLRASVKAKVAADQRRGLPLSEIVVQVREMVRVAEEGTHQSKSFPPHAFPAISRQAIAWCVEAYQPPVIAEGDDLSARPKVLEPRFPSPIPAAARAFPEPRSNSLVNLVEDHHE